MPRGRPTVLTLMLLVAILGVVFFGANMMRRRRHHLAQAAYHQSRANEWGVLSRRNEHPDRETLDRFRDLRRSLLWIIYAKNAYPYRRSGSDIHHALHNAFDRLKNREKLIRTWEAQVAAQKANATYYRNLVRRDLHAARYPWLPVEPDPPMPE